MATTGIFTQGFTLPEVIQIQAKAKALVLEGKTIMSYSDSGTSSSKQFTLPVREVLEECQYALSVLDPVTYGSPVRPRTVASSYSNHRFIH